MIRATLIFATIGSGTVSATAEAQTSTNTAGFMNSGQTATIDCPGGQGEIMGSNNNLTITGNCTTLALSGPGNTISIHFAPGGQISFLGSHNTISWTSVDGKSPKVTYMGSGNKSTPPIQ